MSKRAYSRAAITQRMFNTPLQVMPDTAAIVLGAVGERFDVSQLFIAAEGRTLPIGELEEKAAQERVDISARAGADQLAPKAAAGELMRVIEGVAFIEVRGELVAENGIGPVSGFTGYDGIRAQVLSADADSGVKGIVLDVDSPGGEVAGLYELTKVMMARRGSKPMRAVVRGLGASAAYAVACCADEITLNPLGIAGSIGTIAMHADFSGKLANEGIKVTLIFAGAHKADGNPFEPLPDDVRERIAAHVTVANEQFVGHVAAARGMAAEAVRGLEAEIFRGEEAIGAGLVDRIMSWADSIDEFTQQVNNPGASSGSGVSTSARPARAPTLKEGQMAEQNNDPVAPASEFTQASQDAAVATARTEATTAERSRISALAELDADSSISPALSAAIEGGQTAGDFAIAMAKAGKQQQADALSAARADAVQGTDMPQQRTEASASTATPNRGVAAVERLKGKHKGLPARA